MVQLFEKLGLSTSIDIGDGKTADLQSMTVEDAQNLIADNGYWGVEQTSSRIADFAVSQIGNDPSKLDKIKEAIMNGFNSAKEAFGGQLPDISQKTIDAVMNKLDNLAMPASS
jgi:predicted Zn-dependent protease with MMP-like domain